jgi:hypothetical protein
MFNKMEMDGLKNCDRDKLWASGPPTVQVQSFLLLLEEPGCSSAGLCFKANAKSASRIGIGEIAELLQMKFRMLRQPPMKF